MEPYNSYMHTYGPITEGAGVDNKMHQFFGSKYGMGQLPKRTTVLNILTQNKHLNLYGKGMGDAGTNAAAATAGGATVALFSGAILTGLALNYAVGRFIGAPAIEYFSGNKLTDKQKSAVGITTMLF